MNLESYSLNKNGLIEMHRNVILSLLKYVKEPAKVRALFAISQEIYGWKSHRVFHIYRWENTGAYVKKEEIVHRYKEEVDYRFKTILLGDAGSGKSALLSSYFEDKFVPSYLATIGILPSLRCFSIDSKKILGIFLDTPGPDCWRTIRSSYYRGIHGAMIFYAIDSRTSFLGVVSWLEEIKASGADPSVVLMLVGCKSDRSRYRVVSTEEAKAFAQANGMLFAETTAKQPASTEKAFNMILQEVFKNVMRSSASIYRDLRYGAEKKQNTSVVVIGDDHTNKRKPKSNCF